MKLVDLVISVEGDRQTRHDAKELRFHAAMWTSLKATAAAGKDQKSSILKLPAVKELSQSIRTLVETARAFAAARGMSVNQASKAIELVHHLTKEATK